MFSSQKSKIFIIACFLSALFTQDVFLEINSYNNGTLEIYMENSTPVAGFQMDIESDFDYLSLGDTFDGSAYANGFFISVG